MSNTRLEQILDIVNANSEEAVDDLLTLLHPEDHTKEEIQESYEEVVGYDPTSYFDKQEIDEIICSIRDDVGTPSDVVEYITHEKEELIKESYEHFESDKLEHLSDAVNKVLKDKFGWSNLEDDIEDLELDDDAEDDDF